MCSSATHRMLSAQGGKRGGSAGRASCCTPRIAGAALMRKHHSPGAQCTGRGGDAGRASCCAPNIAGDALMRKHHSTGAQRTGRGGDAGRAGCCAPDLAGGTHVLRRHSPGAQRTGRKRDLQGERYAAPSKSQGPELRCALNIAGAGASVVLRPQIMQALRLCASAARQVLSARGGEEMQGERVAAPRL